MQSSSLKQNDKELQQSIICIELYPIQNRMKTKRKGWHDVTTKGMSPSLSL